MDWTVSVLSITGLVHKNYKYDMVSDFSGFKLFEAKKVFLNITLVRKIQIFHLLSTHFSKLYTRTSFVHDDFVNWYNIQTNA